MRFNELITKIKSYSHIPDHFKDILKRLKLHRDDVIIFM